MPKGPRKTYRASLVLELPEDPLLDLEDWFRDELDSSIVAVGSGRELGVVLATSASRHRETFEPFVTALTALRPDAVSVVLGPELASLPSRRRPQVLVLPTRYFGRDKGLTALIDHVAGGPESAWGSVRSSHIVVGHARAADKTSIHPPGRLPGPLPRALRGPFNAVRLVLYCSTIMSEGRDLIPLARVELPEMAAVR